VKALVDAIRVDDPVFVRGKAWGLQRAILSVAKDLLTTYGDVKEITFAKPEGRSSYVEVTVRRKGR
jgi:hypothetical protein